MNFNDLPKRYSKERLFKKALNANPTQQLQEWLAEAEAAHIDQFNAMALATANSDGKPSCRTVLLKHLDERGLVFYTNYTSRKSQEIDSNPFAMVTIFWNVLMRQVCIEGSVEKISEDESAAYFSKRPRGSQIGAWASEQDKVIASFEVLENSFKEIEKKYRDREIPLPPFWGGYRLIPTRFEFWHGGRDRLHDRFQYLLKDNQWEIERQAP